MGRYKVIILIMVIIVISVAFYSASYWNLIPRKSYSAEDFEIEIIISEVDFNQNGFDDYTALMLGARIDAENKPKYDGQYWADGYPPDDIGVCTDVIWRAFSHAGYSLKDMIDQDIAENIELYPRTNGIQDRNIDFRRVPNLMVYFDRYAVALTLDPTNIEEWQPGDIVSYKDNHIAIVSDQRNKHGVPYIIHNGGQPKREEDALERMEISGHYRFDASLLEAQVLVSTEEN